MSSSAIHSSPASKPQLQPPHYRLSTNNLNRAALALKVVASGIACYINPQATLQGAACGAISRCIVESRNTQGTNETHVRATRLASLCLSALCITYITTVPQPHSWIPLLLGYTATADNVYSLLQKITN